MTGQTHHDGSQTRADGSSPPRSARRLVELSFLMLFVELGLIRWSGAYNVYLSFFTNFVLLASFLGVGVGFLRPSGSRSLLRFAPLTLAMLVGFLAVFPVQGARVDGVLQVVGGFGWAALPRWLSLPVVFALAFAVMASIASGVADTFARFESLDAYRLDIFGSILGILAFSALSFLETPPLAWGGVLVAVLLLTAWHERGSTWLLVAPAVAILLVLSVLSFAPRTYWSPYQRVTTSVAAGDGSVDIEVNGRPHQRIMPLTVLGSEQEFRFTPYERAPANRLRNVLIIGAGSGNDVAIALQEGARHVDAVEIDPVLLQLGRDLHPDHPYDDPRVTAHVQDGRAFLHDTETRFDLVLFAIPDSLTALAGQSSLRLENYLFTEEAIQEVKEHLAEGGVVAMYHYYLPSVVDRYAGTLERVFGTAPCVDRSPGAGPRPRVVLTASLDPDRLACPSVWQRPADVPEPDTDDFPFPYLTGRGIPAFYLVSLFLILVASVAGVRLSGARFGGMRGYMDLFFMGAAFLLLETMNVVRFALLFGTTWFVNALVFGGILLSVFAAIEVARRWRPRRPALLYGLLLLALTFAWAVPPSDLLSLDFGARFVAAVVLGFSPVFIGNLIFAERFRDVAASRIAFGTNLLGAMVGGVLEYGALIVGYRALLVAVAILYGFAFVFGRSHLRGGADPSAVVPPSPSRSDAAYSSPIE